MTQTRRLDVLYTGVALTTLLGLVFAWSGDGTSASAFSMFTNSVQLALLFLACVAALRSARLLGRGTPAAPAWRLLGVGLSVFLAAEVLDAWYEVVEHTNRPFPSLTDVLFVCSYLFLVPALVSFIRVYRTSGYEVGTTGEHAGIAGVGVLVSIVVGYAPLYEILTSGAPLVERLLSVTYPLLDFATLILVLVLLRIAVAFRGGQIWAVWMLLLLGFAFTCAADILFAFLSAGGVVVQRPLMEALYLLSYLALARGALYEYEMLSA